MSRVQLALNVSDLDSAIAFYSKLFNTPPSKIRPGYANFAVAEPPLKLVLIENGGAPGTLNHLGVEVDNADEVHAAQRRLAGQDLSTTVEYDVSCCYAVQDKVWVDSPDGSPWEIYTVLADTEMLPATEIPAATERPAATEIPAATEMPAGELDDSTPPSGACCTNRPDLAAPAGSAACC